MVAQDGGLARLEGHDEAHAPAVLRHVGQAPAAQAGAVRSAGIRRLARHPATRPRPSSTVRSAGVHRLAREQDPPAGRGPEPGQRLQQLALAVAGHPGDADDLARPHRERDGVHPRRPAGVVHAQALHREQRPPRPRRALLHPEQHPPSHHQLGELGDGGPRGVAVGHHRALAHDRDPIRHRHDLPQLVGDQDDRPALGREPAQDAEQVVRLLGGERAGGLVQDQDPRPPVEGLQDLHPLLQAHRQIAGQGLRGDVQGVFPRQPRQLPPRPRRARGEPRPALHAQDHVLRHRERVHQHEVLVDHADAGGDGVPAAPDGHRPPGDADLPPVGPVEAVEDVHQGGLAGAVLADDPVDGPRRDGQAHVPVGVHGAETLVDAAKLDRRRDGSPAVVPVLLPRLLVPRLLVHCVPRLLRERHGAYFTGHSPPVT